MPKHKPKGPLTFQGAPLTLKLAPDGSLRLKVLARPAGDAPGQPAVLHLHSAGEEDPMETGQQILLQLAPRSDCIIAAR